MKRMLINATQEEELRVALVDGQRLYDLNIELPGSESKKANIYKGKITRIEPSLEAAFVDFGADRHGFLPLKEISSEYFVRPVEPGSKPEIKDVLKEGQDIVVQIDKEERGNKGAALTTYVSLAGRFIVLKPNKAHSGGVSRRIVGSDRDLARRSLGEIDVPEGMSVILRTAGIDRSAEELAWDLENLLTIWRAILNVVLQRPSPFLIYRESNAVVRALRDYLTTEIGEILIDDAATYEEAVEFVDQVMPHNRRKIRHYTDPVPLFTRFQIESQIESAFAHTVNLPSGGSIVIDHTEALVSIDINSARATKGGDIEATALNTNLEAADEIARQLRIRDLGGLIVIDFIDMGLQKHQRDVESRLREAVRQDRARVQIGKITRFGLLEMSRQRLRPSLGESSYLTCPRCSGHGTIRSVESLALAILRIIGEEARKERTAKVVAQLPIEVATYLLNEKRDWVSNVESRHDTQVILVANPSLETPHYLVRRIRDDQTELPENVGVSYGLADSGEEPDLPPSLQERKAAELAAVGTIKPVTPAPEQKKRKQPGSEQGFFARLLALFSSKGKKKRKKSKKRQKSKPAHKRSGEQRRKSASQAKKQADERRESRGKSKDAKKKSKHKKKGAQGSAQPQRQKKAKKSQGPDHDRTSAAGDKPSRTRRSRGGRRRRRGDTERTTEQESKQVGTERTAEQENKQVGTETPQTAKNEGAPAEKSAPSERMPKSAAQKGNGGERPQSDAEAMVSDTRQSMPQASETTPPADTSTEVKESGAKTSAERAKPGPEKKPSGPAQQGRLLPWDEPSAIKDEKTAEVSRPAVNTETPSGS